MKLMLFIFPPNNVFFSDGLLISDGGDMGMGGVRVISEEISNDTAISGEGEMTAEIAYLLYQDSINH